jgi:uncharacterized protein (DUF1501 family)
MLHLESDRGVRTCDGVTRRDFLRAGGLAMGLSLTELAQLQQLGAAPTRSDKACIQIFLVGGPSQLDTWDLKPDAPEDIRGPFRPIRTNVPGIDICEHFPRMARLADRFAVLRSVHHREAPIHETGQQLLQTGYLSSIESERPHFGAVVSKLRPTADMPPWVMLPAPIQNTGVSISHGQGAGFLGREHEALVVHHAGIDPARLGHRWALVEAVDSAQQCFEQAEAAGHSSPAAQQAADRLFNPRVKQALDLASEPETLRDCYGWNTFGQSCLLARRLVQSGVRLVTINMFDTVFNQITWDCHANGGDLNTTLADYAETLCPMLDAAYSTLLSDLEAHGLLASTLVVAAGEFGRTPQVNARNGREHWPGVWSMLLAGGGVRGGQVIGASDAHGAEPRERPIQPAEVVATVYHALAIDLATQLPTADGRLVPLIETRPILELF